MAEKKTSERNKCLQAFQKLRRLQESTSTGYCQCISCGKLMHYKDAQGGHYISRMHRCTEMEPDNVHPQCFRCNINLSGNVQAYRFGLLKKIGARRVERLENMLKWELGGLEPVELLSEKDLEALEVKKSVQYYKQKRKEFTDEIKRLEREKV